MTNPNRMTPSAPRDTRDGIVVGLLAYVSVAAFYALFDVLAARGTLYTVNLLGRAVFRGLRDPSILQYPVALDQTAIASYNGLHLIASLLIGVIVVRLVGYAERGPSKAWWALTTVVAGYFVTVFCVGWLSSPIRAVLPWWSIVAANGSAVLAGAIYLTWRRPGLLTRLGILSE